MLKSGRARHEQISEWLREQIEQGGYAPDEQLPSESQLGEQFDVSRITVRRALQTLEGEGLIYRRQGLGSFVRERRVRQGFVRLTDFVEDMGRAGITASSRVIRFGPVEATHDVALRLALQEGQVVVQLDRLRLGDGEPVAFDRTWLPVFYGQLLDRHDLERETIYHILENEYQVPVLRGRYRIEAVNADAEIAGYLEIAEGTAVLLIERISYTHGEKHIYFQRRYYRNDRVAYEMELERDPLQKESHPDAMPLQEFEPIFKKE